MKILKWIASVVLLTTITVSASSAATITVPDGYNGSMDDGNTYLASATFQSADPFTHTFQFSLSEGLSALVELGNYTGTPGIDDFQVLWDGFDLTTLGSSFTTMLTSGSHTLVISGTPRLSITDPTNLPSYNIGIAVSAVPVPAAFWLFGSALVAFIGFGRRSAA